MTGPVAASRVRAGFYLDSVALMRVSRRIADRPGVAEASLTMASPANKDILREAGLLDPDGAAAGPNDLVIAVRARDRAALEAALEAAEAALDDRGGDGGAAPGWRPRSLETALEALPGANMAIVSVPGEYAAREARRALERGLNVMLFSDNVAIEDEAALKDLARARGLLLMGPDCGTALIAGAPLGFANAVPRGDVGLIAASGTGLQEIACLIAAAGGGVSHGIGTGGRDLSAQVGGRMTLAALDALDADPATRRIVLVSKPPDPAAADRVAARIARSRKRFTLCFIGMAARRLPENAVQAATLRQAAADALGDDRVGRTPGGLDLPPPLTASGLRGLFAGGSLCGEAQAVLMEAGLAVASNAPVPGAAAPGAAPPGAALLLDLGADEYTRGRPHPMIEPAVRAGPLARAMADPEVGAVLVDVVLGYGAHADPAGELAAALGPRRAGAPAVIASVCGVEADPQTRSDQVARLREAGVVVAASNAEAAEAAAVLVSGRAASAATAPARASQPEQ